MTRRPVLPTRSKYQPLPRSGLILNSTWKRQGSTKAFSLVEIMVVVTIISLLAMMAVPTMQIVQRKARAAALVNDFRVFSEAFSRRAHEMGGWPAEVDAGLVPPEMEGIFKGGTWDRPTPVGGLYKWVPNDSGRRVIRVESPSEALMHPALLTEIDRLIDAGDGWDDGEGSFFRDLDALVFVVER